MREQNAGPAYRELPEGVRQQQPGDNNSPSSCPLKRSRRGRHPPLSGQVFTGFFRPIPLRGFSLSGETIRVVTRKLKAFVSCTGDEGFFYTHFAIRRENDEQGQYL